MIFCRFREVLLCSFSFSIYLAHDGVSFFLRLFLKCVPCEDISRIIWVSIQPPHPTPKLCAIHPHEDRSIVRARVILTAHFLPAGPSWAVMAPQRGWMVLVLFGLDRVCGGGLRSESRRSPINYSGISLSFFKVVFAESLTASWSFLGDQCP